MAERELDREHVDKLYEPLTDNEKREILHAIRHNNVSGPNRVMSSAANKIEAQLHLSVTGHRIYEGP
jgi:hypothetical protein